MSPKRRVRQHFFSNIYSADNMKKIVQEMNGILAELDGKNPIIQNSTTNIFQRAVAPNQISDVVVHIAYIAYDGDDEKNNAEVKT